VSRQRTGNRKLLWLAMKLRRVNPYLGSFTLAILFLGLAFVLPEGTSHWSASAILLMAVLASASLWGLKQGLIASFAVALAYDYFFVPPVYSLDIDDWQNALSVLILGLTAATVSILADRLNRKTLAARQNEILAKRQARLSQRMREAAGAPEIAQSVTASAGVALGAKALLVAPGTTGFEIIAAHPADLQLSPAEAEAAYQAIQTKPRKIGEAVEQDGMTCTIVQTGPDVTNHVILIVYETNRRFWRLPSRTRTIDMIAGAASSAFRRVALQKLAEDARIDAETEKLRSALLASISHDLKTPLAVVLGSASSLKDLNSGLSERAAQDLLQAILDEGERLNQFIGNLLDMTRVESEAVRPKRELADLNDIIGSALRRAGRPLAQHRVLLRVPNDLPSLEVDPVLMEKALFNILENAANYTPAGTQVTVSVVRQKDTLLLQVWDEGQGIPPQELPQVFDKFFRGGTGAWKPTGTGLGLSIARGFIQAMGGAIAGSNRTDRSGAVFTIKLPISKAKWQSTVILETRKAS